MASIGAQFADYIYTKANTAIKTSLTTNSDVDYWKTTMKAQASQAAKARCAASVIKCTVEELRSNETKLDFDIRVEELYNECFPPDDGTQLDIPTDVDELEPEELTVPIRAKNSKKEVSVSESTSKKSTSEPSAKPTRITKTVKKEVPKKEVDESEEEPPKKPAKKAVKKAVKKEVVEEEEEESEPPKKPAKKPAKKEVVDDDDISEEEPKPKKPKADKASKPKAKPKAEEEELVDGIFDYQAINVDTDIVNTLYDAITEVMNERPLDEPPKSFKSLEKQEDGSYQLEEHDSNYDKLNRDDIQLTNIEGVDAKIQTSTLIIKYKVSYVQNEKLRDKNVTVKYIANDAYEAVAELDEAEQAMFDVFKEYLEQVKPKGEAKKWVIDDIEPAINSDAVISHKDVSVHGIMDTTRNIPIGPYKMSYNIENTDEFLYREQDYSKLFEFMRRTAAHYSPANLIKAMINTYKNRHLIIYHADVFAHIDEWWKQAADELADEAYNEDEAALKWRAILASPQCKLVIARGWPARAEFDKHIKELIKYQTKSDIRGSTYHKYTMPTLDMMCGPLFSISFIFGPFAVAMKACPVDEKTRSKFPGATVDRYAEALGSFEARYADCNWCAALIQGLENDDVRSFRAILILSPKHLGTKTGK